MKYTLKFLDEVWVVGTSCPLASPQGHRAAEGPRTLGRTVSRLTLQMASEGLWLASMEELDLLGAFSVHTQPQSQEGFNPQFP